MSQEVLRWSSFGGRATDLGIEGATEAADFYTSHEQFAIERENIFRRNWLMVARESDVPGPGDFIKAQIPTLDGEAVIVRGQDGVVRAFHNACPHRGVALVRECKGKTGVFVCPYHAWSFDTKGALRGMPGAEDFPHVDRKTIGLSSVHLQCWNGFIFLNFADEPHESLMEFLGDFAVSLGDLPFGEYSHVVEIAQDVQANWKLLVDASNEGYHLATLHRNTLGAQVTASGNPHNHFCDPLFSGPHATATTQANHKYLPRHGVEKFIYATAAPLATAAEGGESGASGVGKTFAEHPMVNRVNFPAFSVESTHIFPCTVLQMLADRYIWFQYWPVSPGKTRFVLKLFSRHAPHSYRTKFAEAHLLAYSRDIVTEDASITQFQQSGLESGGVTRVYFGENEYMLRFFHANVKERCLGYAPQPIA